MGLQIILVLVASLLCNTYASFVDECPEKCDCYITKRGGNKGDNSVTDCSYSGLVNVPTGISKDTTILHLKGNKIKTIPRHAFDGLVNLEKLYINYNGLKSLDSDVFNKLTKLTYLDMHKNNIKEIPKDLFKHTTSLETLKMMKLKIKSLPARVFYSLVNLRSLRLEGNADELSPCSCNLIKKSEKLKCTDWSQNTCTFKDSEDEIEFTLDDSFTSSCPKKCKCYYHNGKKVTSCAHKGLRSVPAGISHETETLYLNHNEIPYLRPNVFDDLTNLEALFLRGNKLTVLGPNVFNKLLKLKKLFLNYNELSSLLPGTFNNTLNLDVVDLHGNLLNELRFGVFDANNKIQYLDLHNNYIEKVSPGWFDSFPSLKILRFEGNPLLKCECSLVKKFKHVTMPGSFGKCKLYGLEKKIIRWKEEESCPRFG